MTTPEQIPNTMRRRTLLGASAVIAVTAAGCGAKAASGSAAASSASTSTSQATAAATSTATPTTTALAAGAGASAGATPAAAGNTRLSAGTYKATFATTGSGGAGNSAGGTQPGGTAPSGSAPGGTAPTGAAPGGTAPGGAPGGSAPGGSSSGGTQTLQGAYLVNGTTATIDGGTWTSTKANQNVFLVVNGGHLTIRNATIVKSGDSTNEDGCNFYGLNAAVLVVGKGSSVTMTNCRVTTSAEGANALFSANAATLHATGVTIRTSKNSSRGLDATYEGVITASNLDIATTGAHCACLATDRGNGTVTVTGTNVLSAAGDGSPLVYSTGKIALAGATGTASGAQTMVIEGKNSITLTHSSLTTTGTEGMMIYQSFSGDAADASATTTHSTMTITDSVITSTSAKPMVYVTNTTCVVDVTKSRLVHPSGSKLLSLQADRWGTSGSNGGKASVTFANCGTLTGDLVAGSTSAATVKATGGTTLSGKTSGSVKVTKA